MTQEGTKRKLTAILSADVKEYSRLMSQDERGTIRTLTAYKEAMSMLIQQYKGRVVDSPGDNLLAEFGSVVDAVNCAVEIQRELAERNAELPPARQMEFRIGINLGDVVEEEGRIYGDGVNIAARVEGLAEGGGICISGTAYDQVVNKLGLEYEFLGEQEVKNIERPVRVYRVLSFPGAAAHRVVQAKGVIQRKWRKAALAIAVVLVIGIGAVMVWNFYFRPPPIEPASIEKMAFPLPDKPSIAVLPFVNMSGDPEQEYIADGITENIITALSKIPEMFVIARTSTSTYKGKAVKVKQVSEELGVRYVLEGSVQKVGDRIRVTAQLIDAISGHHLWADRYDRDIENFFDLLDEITKKVVIELRVKLTEGEFARISHKTENFEAWAYATTAYSLLKHLSKENYAKGRELCEKAVKLDPGYGFAWGVLGSAHGTEAIFGWSESRDKSFKLAVEYTDKALKLDETLSCSTAVKGRLHRTQGQFDEAIAVGEKAIALGPSHDIPYSTLSNTMRLAGRFEESITLMKKAMRLNPHYPAWYLAVLASSYFFEERYEEALEARKRVLERAQKGEFPPFLAHLGLSAAYMELGREEEARAHAAEVLRINPKFSLEYLRKTSSYKDPADLERYLQPLRKAGLPEKPPLPLPDKPSIAVLPFVNISGDPEQEYFTDGMTDTLITDLSKISGLFVIARNSVFTYKGKPVKVAQIGRELGVRYVMEGSVQKADNQVRINAQLIDTTTGGHLWAERYDGKMDDIFALQDKITGKIVTALAVKLTASEQEQVTRKGTDNMEAYDAFLKGQAHYLRWTRDDMPKAVFYFKRAIELDPNYGRAYAGLGWVYWYATAVWLDITWMEARDLALKYLQLAMKKPTPDAHALAARINSFLRLHKEALSEAERALALAPNDPSMHGVMAHVLIFAGRPKEAIKFAEFEMRHDPRQIYLSLYLLGLAHFSMGKLEQAATYFERSLKHNPEFHRALSYLAATYAHLGRSQQARAALEEFTRKAPYASHLRALMYFCPFKDMEVADRLADGVLKAGLPGQPSGYYKISEKNRLTGKELRELVLGTDSSKYWIEGDMLCTKKWKLLSGCYPVFRNPEGTPEGKDEYLLIHGAGFLAFSTIPRLKEEAVEALDMKWIEWASDADGFGKDGIFTRKNPPAFSFDYPADFKKHKPSLGRIFDIRSPGRLPIIILRVLKITGDVNESLQGSPERFEKAVGFQATDIKVIYNKPLPPDTYGEDHPAYEWEVEFKLQRAVELTTYCNVIAKEGHLIALYYAFSRKVDRARAVDEAKAIFKTIDLKP